MLPRGTGIATYSRHVLTAISELGYAADLLIRSNAKFRKANAAVNNVRVELPMGSGNFPLFSRQIRSHIRGIHGFPKGIDLYPLDMQAAKNSGGMLAQQHQFERGYAAYDLYDIARQHALRWGEPLPLRIQDRELPDLLHGMQTLPMRVPGKPWIVTIHDIIPLMAPGSTPLNLRHYRKIVDTVLRHADHIVTISEHSRNDLIQVMGGDPNRITNINQAIGLADSSDPEHNSDVEGDLDFYELEPQEYFLFVGAIEPKKNVRRLIEAFDGSRTKRPLVLVGGLGWDYSDALEAVEKMSPNRLEPGPDYIRGNHVRRMPYVPRQALVSLIKGARAVLFPSLYEGFGLPVAEAMALGAPVMTSNTTSLPEVAGDAALLVDPHDVVAMAKAIRRLDHDDALRAELSAKGIEQVQKFSPQKHREKLDAIYRKFL